MPTGVGVLVPQTEGSRAGGGEAVLWLGEVTLREQPGPLPRSRPLSKRPRLPIASWHPIELHGNPAPGMIFIEPDRIAFWKQARDGSFELRTTLRDEASEPEWKTIAIVRDVPAQALPLFFAAEHRTALVWQDDAPRTSTAAKAGSVTVERPVRYVAFSLDTGRELARGEITIASALGSDDIGLVVIVMGYVLGLVAMMVFRPSASSSLDVLPEGVALAEPLRRFLAGSIDLTIALLVGGLLIGWTFGEVVQVSVSAMFQTGEGHRLLGAILAAGLLHGTIGEGIFGRTLGKLLVGIHVVRAHVTISPQHPGHDPAPWARPGLLSALLRNAIKWLLPPLGLLALWSPAGRHRGEQYSRTFVVEPIEDDGEIE
jgi:hypothetical protein